VGGAPLVEHRRGGVEVGAGVAEGVDDPAEEERQPLAGLLVGVGGQLDGDGEAEHVVVEGP
jgi:hypothetical protein